MPTSPGDAATKALAQFGDSLHDQDRKVLTMLVQAVMADSPGALPALLDRLRAYLTGTGATTLTGIVSALTGAYTTSYIAAGVTDVVPPARVHALAAAEKEAQAVLTATTRATVGWAARMYQQTLLTATRSVLTGTTRDQAVQTALNSLASRGVTSMVDSAGRHWTPATYTEAHVRTAAGRAAIDGHVAALADVGLELVYVHPGPRACEVCDSWTGKILTTGSQTGRIQVDSLTEDSTVTVNVTATLADARSHGWGHANCRCSLSTYLPGASSKPEPVEHDAAGYAAQQEQRALERRVRDAKTAAAIAVTPDAKSAAQKRTAAALAALRDHLTANPALKRR